MVCNLTSVKKWEKVVLNTGMNEHARGFKINGSTRKIIIQTEACPTLLLFWF